MYLSICIYAVILSEITIKAFIVCQQSLVKSAGIY